MRWFLQTLVTVFFAFGHLHALCQDTLVTLTNETLDVKVTEVDYSNEMVRFKKSAMPNGPIYSEYLSNIFLVKIQNTPSIYNDPYENPYPGYQSVVPISMKRLERYSPAEWEFDVRSSRDALKKHKASFGDTFVSTESKQRFQRIFDEVVDATKRYCKSRKFSVAGDFDWDYIYVDCVEDNHGDCKIHTHVTHQQLDNAYSMGHGNFFFTEIFFKDVSDGVIAGVVAHEIGHSLAMHLLEENRKRNDQKEIADWVALGTTVAHGGNYHSNRNKIAEFTDLFFMLPYSRSHENEADMIGAVLMTLAGYDPNEMVTFWGSGDNATQTDFRNTHPGGIDRANNIEKLINSPEFQILIQKR